jgi:NAD(P)H-hydrate epimerase
MMQPSVPMIPAEDLPWLTTQQMLEVDRRMIEVRRITLMQMMENAGRHLARLAVDRYALDAGSPSVLVLAGKGGNGGGAMVAARRLHGWGLRVSVILSADDDVYQGVPASQLSVLAALRVPISTLGEGGIPSARTDPSSEDKPSLILDGLIGYSLSGAPRGPARALIQFANAANAPVLSLDVPSGLNATTGRPSDPTVRADATLTLALPKIGLRGVAGSTHVGDLFMADISVPPQLYKELGIGVPDSLFAASEILRVVE